MKIYRLRNMLSEMRFTVKLCTKSCDLISIVEEAQIEIIDDVLNVYDEFDRKIVSFIEEGIEEIVVENGYEIYIDGENEFIVITLLDY